MSALAMHRTSLLAANVLISNAGGPHQIAFIFALLY